MESLKRKLFSLGLVLLLAGLSFGFVRIIFSPTLQSKEELLQRTRSELLDAKALLLQKENLQSNWEKAKLFLPKAQNKEEALNEWVKGLLNLAQSEGMVFTKLEPETGGEKTRLFLSFQGDIRKLIRFLYHLLEKDPLSRLEGIVLKQEEETKTFVYELGLRSVILRPKAEESRDPSLRSG